MGIKQKFAMLAGIVGIVLAIVSIVGYYTAYSNLEESVEREISATVAAQGAEMEGWLMEKAKPVTSEADLMTELSGMTLSTEDMRHMLSLAASDKDVQEMTRGDENLMFLPYYSPDETGKTDPTKRPWYSQAREAGKTVYTEVYQSKSTGDLVVSAVAPFYDKNKKFIGAICGDITLSVLEQQVQKVKYREAGNGYIIEKTGKLLATAGNEPLMSEASEIPGIGKHLSEMFSKDSGFFSFENNEGEQVFAYTTVPSTGWVIGMAVPYDFVFAAVHKLRIMYALLTLIGIAMVVVASQAFAQRITKPIIALEDSATSLASGDLTVSDVPVESADEIGSMTNAFNQMKKHLHKLISQMAVTSEQVSAASEQLTASAQQSANASVNVAETVGEVASGMDQQLKDIDGAKRNVDEVFIDIANMTKQAESTSDAADNAAAASKQRGAMMKAAVDKMGEIEKSVTQTADVVKKLGESSQQIGEIVETISAISDQTNLLALNAAIEAARAGEHGRGFAVVAEEVRKLAAGSQEAAEQIKTRIAAIQRDTLQAVDAMKGGQEKVQDGTQTIREIGGQFQEFVSTIEGIKNSAAAIRQSVEAVSGGATHVVEAMDSIDTVSRRTSENTQTISAATEEQSASNEEIAAASQSLAKLASDMQDAIHKFKL